MVLVEAPAVDPELVPGNDMAGRGRRAGDDELVMVAPTGDKVHEEEEDGEGLAATAVDEVAAEASVDSTAAAGVSAV